MDERSTTASAQTRAHLRPSFYATKPTRETKFLRIFLPYQMWRFVWINLKMIGIIRRSHH